MKIVIVSAFDNFGGAARGAYTIHQGLLNKGYDSIMLVGKKVTNDPKVISLEKTSSKVRYKIIKKLDAFFLSTYKKKFIPTFTTSFYSTTKIAKIINQLKPDIVHLQWVANGLLTYKSLTKIDAPIVWTLRDMMPFTGGCHYSEGCSNFKKSCGCCPVLGSDDKKDLSNKIFKNKEWALDRINKRKLCFTGLSEWITQECRESRLLGGFAGYCVPNIIDDELYTPKSRKISREKLSLPLDKKIILFGALGAKTDPRKGYKYLSEALKSFESDAIVGATFGSQDKGMGKIGQIQCYNFGLINDDSILVDLYNSADVMVVPSLQEAFGKTIGEAMACGVPVVAFDESGPKDLIDHQRSGYLAKLGNADDLRSGILWVLNHDDPESLSDKAREKIRTHSNSDKIINQYLEVYKKMIG